MFFWLKTAALYVATAVFAFLISLVGSLCLVRVLNGPFRPNEDSPGLGLLLILLFVVVSSLLVPAFLGLAAELVQDKVLVRRFNWTKGLLRVLLSLPMSIGPAYAFCVLTDREDSRPAHWLAKLMLFGCVSGAFAYLALRIKRPVLHLHSLPARQDDPSEAT